MMSRKLVSGKFQRPFLSHSSILVGLPLAVFNFKDKLDARFSNIYGQSKKEQ
jgi:hypothetical protein